MISEIVSRERGRGSPTSGPRSASLRARRREAAGALEAFEDSHDRKEGCALPGVKLKENESFEGALKRFKKQCEKAGIMYELRRREHYEKPSVRKKKKAIAARKRLIKKLRAGR